MWCLIEEEGDEKEGEEKEGEDGAGRRETGEEDNDGVVEGLGRMLGKEEEKDFSETPFPHFTFSLIEKTVGNR